jgi:hypothetical protein
MIRKAIVTHFNKRLLDYTKLNLNTCVLCYILWESYDEAIRNVDAQMNPSSPLCLSVRELRMCFRRGTPATGTA